MRFWSWFWLIDLALLLVIAGLNFFAWRYFWYWRFDAYGFDKLMHLLGGLLIGLTVAGLWCWWREKKSLPLKKRDLFSLVGLAVLAIGGSWEVIEWNAYKHEATFLWIKHFADLTSGWLDTTTDFISDLVGGLLGASLLYLWRRIKN
ncbi:MAG: hypothetical protein UV64_C0012G0007 [Parcubacteria group bacterium GW2011_GWC1_43_11b]|uniref:VanZ-like domain-containing protein n=1 Tax=Candidatus Vogelbacteria bacterium RIFOXYB1_FULL_42_16 TaxID=1802436 RepID=A0A1G2QBR9_9BACT|nr:MAG: hypothetical protein UV50_C0006G0007 [Parcubacteria group bacterium GW2011_GWB1_42_9]KKS89080.1 MAG: hypothetical protein UV64_C0012G0007 [Parcubacteria group bacterium GW2011_GWC1_43_11b]KKT09730.1 MAG: hypothetical protein UV88_C0005G0007 [Parcubacteria group bacterium GW2011_GWA1_43_21]OHA57947.1 MAG: hypothetical protein A2370_00945 [Candidatus Vogelbacteria bacterium RIFOXYB1_FULL_42_16]